MRSQPSKLDLPAVAHATHRANERKESILWRALRVIADPDREKRLQQLECPVCFYIDNSRISGQAFTDWQCSACLEEQPSWPNTGVPKLCKKCAAGYGLCVECLADLELRPRLKLERRKK